MLFLLVSTFGNISGSASHYLKRSKNLKFGLTLEDGYPEWHPASYPFQGILKLFFYREITGNSYRKLSG